MFGLVVVLSIPALSGLGGQVFNSLNATNQQQDNFNQLVGLLGAPGNAMPGGGGGLFSGNGINGSQLNLGGQNFSFSENENGTLTFSDGSNTTSIEGSTVMSSLAQEIQKITASPEALSELNDSERHHIEHMATLANTLAGLQSRLEATETYVSGKNQVEDEADRFSKSTFTDVHKQLNETYREFYEASIQLNNSTLAKTQPELLENINFLSNLGQNIAYQNFLAPEAVNDWYSNLLTTLDSKYTENFQQDLLKAARDVMNHHSAKNIKPPAVSLADLTHQAGAQETTEIAKKLEEHAEKTP